MSHWITNHGLTGENPERMGTSNTILCPLRVFPTKTQPVFVAGTNDAFWKILCTGLGKTDWLADARFTTNKDRVANRKILEPLIEAYFLEHTAEIMREVGYSDAEIAALKDAKAINIG